jgi:hypothetical protein
MTLFDKFYCLEGYLSEVGGLHGSATYSTDGFRHLGHTHKNGKTSSTKSCNGDFVFDIAEFRR